MLPSPIGGRCQPEAGGRHCAGSPPDHHHHDCDADDDDDDDDDYHGHDHDNNDVSFWLKTE